MLINRQTIRGAFSLIIVVFSFLILAIGSSVEAGGFLEVGQVSVSDSVDNGVWATVTLQKNYVNPVVIAGPLTHNNDLSLSVRIRNVTATSFQIGMQSPCESAGGAAGSIICPPAGGWLSETVQYAVFEEGTWEFPDGRAIEADRHTTSTVRANFGGAGSRGDVINYSHSYGSAPTVLATVQTWVDAAWITTTIRAPSGSNGNPPTTAGFRLALEGAEVTSSHGSEAIAWIAIARGSGSNAGNLYDVGRGGGRTVDRHSDGCYSIGSYSFSSSPNVVVQHNSMNGGNGGWFRYCGAGIQASQVNVHVDEDQVRDTERTGIPEYGAWFAYNAGGFGNLDFIKATNTVVDDNGGLTEPGDSLTYTINLTNVQNDFALPNNAAPELSINLPAGTSYLTGSATYSSGTLAYNGILNRMEWNGGIASGAAVSMSYQVTLTAAANCMTISQQAIVNMDPNLDGANSITEFGDDPGIDDGLDLDNDGATADDDPATIQVTCTATTLPSTGFAPKHSTIIPKQPTRYQYESYSSLRLKIPTLAVDEEIVGVPWAGESWNVEWLWNRVGYLEGTSFPTWLGNTVLSAHAFLPNGNPGTFAELSELKWDDEVHIYANGSLFVYLVRESYLTTANDRRPLQHEDMNWITLLSCKGFDQLSESYRWRQVVRAVLVEIR